MRKEGHPGIWTGCGKPGPGTGAGAAGAPLDPGIIPCHMDTGDGHAIATLFNLALNANSHL